MNDESTEGEQMRFDDRMHYLRRMQKQIAQELWDWKEFKEKSETDGKELFGEVMANLTLAYRHMEDASMRLGKVVQARNGGVSIYDHNAVGNPEENVGKTQDSE